MSSFSSQLMSLKLRKPGSLSQDNENESEAPSKTVLQLIRDEGLNPSFGCLEGFCGACRCKIKTGEVEHSDDTLAYMDDDEIIPCTARIKSNEIEIEFSR